MVNSISGKLVFKDPTVANVEVGGFVFNISISLASYEKLPEVNDNISLLTHLHVKEDILELYGFADETERSLFLNLNKINGIGPRSAMNILSGTTPVEFKQKIIDGDVKSLTSIPGIGAKTAKRIIVELKEVFSVDSNLSDNLGFENKKENFVIRDAQSALKSLGYKENQISKAISQLQKDSNMPDKLEDVIRKILKELN
ncbi:MAG: Holliday junction branch migration protein RuvA [Candidatus Neomarinimicrobiota bacterium]|nr:Holliday junction branch migration protein RuvA [Candidatus Neomarinimicrobiota bacterium]MEC8689272.1 Holliday junction branch migration protein RuvA [Candidatus Neomarinimicrobiota bacterium]